MVESIMINNVYIDCRARRITKQIEKIWTKSITFVVCMEHAKSDKRVHVCKSVQIAMLPLIAKQHVDSLANYRIRSM